MAELKFRKKYVLFKKEVTYGTDSVPVATDAILTKNLTISPYEGNRVSRDLDSDVLGLESEINTGPNAVLSFDVEIAGGGSVDTAPQWGVLMEACGFAETITVTTGPVDYDPVSASFASASAYFFIDGQRHRVTGIRGTMSLNISRGQIPFMSFTMTGLYNQPTAATLVPDTTGFQDPVPVTKVNTPTVSILGFATARLESMTVDMNNDVIYRNLPNNEEVFINDRAVRGTLVLEAPDLATKNFFSDIESHNGITTGAIQVIHGTVAGNKVQVDAPKVQLSSITMNDSDGLVAYSMDALFLPSTGDDEIKIGTI